VPAAWPAGEIQGVLCRGQITITRLKWQQNLIQVSLLSALDQTLRLDARGTSQQVTLTAGKEITLEIKP
jgi:hypothetical protein